MQAGLQTRISTNPATEFTEALAAGGGPGSASAVVNLRVPNGNKYQNMVRAITISSVQALEWELWWFLTAAGAAAADPSESTFAGRWQFDPQAGQQLNGAGPYEYVITGLEMFFEDLDSINDASAIPAMHLVLVNQDGTTAKLADAAGAVKVTVLLESMAERF